MFKRLALIAVLFSTLLGVTVALSDGTPLPPKTKSAVTTFEGTSNKGDLEEALKAAIESAMTSRKGIADAMVEWKVKNISGAQGGIAGFNRLTVTIEVKPQ